MPEDIFFHLNLSETKYVYLTCISNRDEFNELINHIDYAGIHCNLKPALEI